MQRNQVPRWWDFGGYNSSSLGIRPSETRQTILNTIPWIQRYPSLALLEPVDQTTLQNSSSPTEHIWWFWWYVFIRIYPCTASLSLKQPHHLSGPKPQRPKSSAMGIVYHCLFHPCLGLFGCYHCWCDRQSCCSRHTVILGHTGTYILSNRRVSNEGVLGLLEPGSSPSLSWMHIHYPQFCRLGVKLMRADTVLLVKVYNQINDHYDLRLLLVTYSRGYYQYLTHSHANHARLWIRITKAVGRFREALVPLECPEVCSRLTELHIQYSCRI